VTRPARRDGAEGGVGRRAKLLVLVGDLRPPGPPGSAVSPP